MTREERAARVEELRRWIAEQNEEFRDEGFPADVQAHGIRITSSCASMSG
jgi:hypothetical protein